MPTPVRTHTHKYVILIAFLRQRFFRERLCVTIHVHCLYCLVGEVVHTVNRNYTGSRVGSNSDVAERCSLQSMNINQTGRRRISEDLTPHNDPRVTPTSRLNQLLTFQEQMSAHSQNNCRTQVSVSSCPRGVSGVPPDRFPSNLILGIFSPNSVDQIHF